MESSCLFVVLGWVLRLILLSGGISADEAVQGFIGHDVTLTCRYDSAYYGPLPACWARGAIPNSGCGNEVIRSDGSTVTSRQSERYVMRGDVSQGDVSLTIRQLEEGDSGTYGCRVDIPGWFNDHKHHTKLTVQPGPPDPVRLELRDRRSRMVLLRWTAGFDGGSPLIGYTLEQKDMAASWGSSAVRTMAISPQLTGTTVTDLQPFSTYNIRMVSKNAVGTSTPSNTLTITTREEVPGGPPLDVQVEALSPSSLQISWKPPRTDLQHGVIQRYIVAYRLHEDSPSLPWTTSTVYATGRRQKLGLYGLVPGTRYVLGVQAVNSEGGGPVSPQLVYSTLEDEHSASTSSYIVTDPPEEPEPTTYAGPEHVDTASVTDSEVTEAEAASTVQRDEGNQTEAPTDEEATTTGGRQSDTISTTTEELSANTAKTEEVKEREAEPSNKGVLGIVIPMVLLVIFIAVMATLWQLKRMKERKGNADISWKNNGALAFSDTHLISDL